MSITSKQYHQETSYQRNKMGGHFLDWENQPNVFKAYPEVTSIHLSREVQFPETTLCNLFKRFHAKKETPSKLTIEDLSCIFMLTYGLTAKARHAGGEFYYRNAASAGALYPTEIYVSTRNVKDLEDGLYHFSIAQHGLCLLRRGDLSPWILKAGQPPNTKPPMLAFFFSAIFFRSAWKYRDPVPSPMTLMTTGSIVFWAWMIQRKSVWPSPKFQGLHLDKMRQKVK
jgi:SagB-type dehydrogenase family enzyme